MIGENELGYFLSKSPKERYALAKNFEDVVREYAASKECDRRLLRALIRVRREYKQQGFLRTGDAS